MSDNASNQKKSTGIIIALGIAILIGIVVLVIAVISLVQSNNANGGEGTTLYTLSGTTQPVADTTSYWGEDEADSASNETQNVNSSVTHNFDFGNDVEAGDSVIVTTTEKADTYDPVAEYEKLSKNGDNILSDHHNNKYIKMVNEKYKVDTDKLVAIYSSPDTGNNFVLEFKGDKDSNGNIIKSPDTLKRVYLIDKAGNIAIATGTTTGNVGVSYAEGTLCFNMVKTIVMPQYPEYFTGV